MASKQKPKKSWKTRSDTAVQGTNDSSIVSKSSVAKLGYFDDEYLQHFVSKTQRRSPLINWGYYIRAQAIDQSFTAFLKHHSPGTKKQIISLGAGFDSSFFRLKALGLLENVVYCEIDFPDLVKRKAALIGQNPVLKGMINSNGNKNGPVFDGADYKLLGVDLTQLKRLETCLSVMGIDWEAPTLLLSEVVLTYMAPEHSSSLIEWAASHFKNAMFVTYEQILPDDAFGIVMLNHFTKMGSPLKAIKQFPTAERQKERYQSLGWTDCQTTNMNNFYYQALDADERKRVGNLELFDEFEEWHLKCSHYILLWALKGSCKDIQLPWLHDKKEDISVKDPCKNQRLCEGSCSFTVSQKQSSKIQETSLTQNEISCLLNWQAMKCSSEDYVAADRLGHTSLLFNDSKSIVVHGGFGSENGQHKRLSSISLITCDVSSASFCVNTMRNEEQVDERLYHTLTRVAENKILVIGGRKSPKTPVEEMILIDLTLSHQQQEESDDTQSKTASAIDVTAVAPVAPSSDCETNAAAPYKSNGSFSWSRFDADLPPSPVVTPGGLGRKECCHGNGTSSDSASGQNPRSSPPSARWRHTATLVEREGKQFIVLFGGRTAVCHFSDDCYVLDVQVKSWRKIGSEYGSPEARHSHTANNWNNDVIVFGGLGHDLQPLNSLYLLDTCKWSWKKIECTPLISRYSHTAHIVDTKLVIIGGVTTLPDLVPGVAILDLETGQGKEYCLPEQREESPIMLHNHTSHLIGGTLFIVGGGGNCFSFGTHLNSTPVCLDLEGLLEL